MLTLKVFGFSNLKIFLILAMTSFLIGCLILLFVNPITSSMSKFYEKTKSDYSRDIDHLVTFNKNGLWIKENLKSGQRIITAAKPEGQNLVDLTIFHINENSNLEEKIISKEANIESNTWILNDVIIFKPVKGVLEKKNFKRI